MYCNVFFLLSENYLMELSFIFFSLVNFLYRPKKEYPQVIKICGEYFHYVVVAQLWGCNNIKVPKINTLLVVIGSIQGHFLKLQNPA
jgi:hypothetical protein